MWKNWQLDFAAMKRGVELRQSQVARASSFPGFSRILTSPWYHVIQNRYNFERPFLFIIGMFIIGSAEALPILCVRCFWWEREKERDTERERRKWRHHCRAKIGDEFTLSFAKNSHNWRWAYTFPCQKFALFVSPFTERSPLWRWNSQWVHTFHCQNFFRPLCSPSFKWHEPRDEWSKTQDHTHHTQMDKWSNPAQSYFVLPIEKMNQINTMPKTIGNRKRDSAWGGSGW